MPISSPEFDALLRREIARSRGGRGGEEDVQGARDRLAKRLNIQEGRTGGGNVSSAYRPQRGSPPASRGSSRGRSAGTSKSKGGGGRKGAPSLPAAGPVLPDRPTDTGGDGGWPGWLLPILMAASKRGQGMMGGEGPSRMPPDQSGGALAPRRVTTQPVAAGGGSIVDAQFEEMQRPLALTGPGDARPIPYSADAGRLPPPAAAPQDAISQFMSQSDVRSPDPSRFMSPEEIAELQRKAELLRLMQEGGGGDVGARAGGQVYRPGVETPAPSPGMFGSRYGQPMLKHIMP